MILSVHQRVFNPSGLLTFDSIFAKILVEATPALQVRPPVASFTLTDLAS